MDLRRRLRDDWGELRGDCGGPPIRPLMLDVESVAGHLLPAGTVFRVLAEHRQRLFPAGMFDDLFPSSRGRPSIPSNVVAAVIVLQTLHGLSDRRPPRRHVRPAVEGGVWGRG